MVSLTDALLVANIGVVLSFEGTILFLIVRYLYGFLGGMDRRKLRILRWKLDRFTALTASDEVLMEEENVSP